MSHMQQDIIRDFGYAVETECGTSYIPGSVVGNLRIRGTHDEGSDGFRDLCGRVRDYVEGLRIASISYVSVCYWGRMSAPGYLDCTEWTPYATLREARDGLRDAYGDDAYGD